MHGPDYRNQAVSNAIHAAIAVNDALCLFHIGERAERASHSEATTALKRACKGTLLEAEAPRRARLRPRRLLAAGPETA